MTKDFEAVYRKHAPAAFRRAQRILGNDADAHEVVHEVFRSLLERPEQYQGRSSMSTFVYGGVTHACLNRMRNHANRLCLVREPVAPQPEQWAIVRAALERLPDEMAQAAIYCHLDGLSHAEIAGLLGCSPRHVGNLLERLSQQTRERESRRCSG